MKDDNERDLAILKSFGLIGTIEKELKRQNFTVKGLAAEMGVSRNTLTSWLRVNANCPVWAVMYLVDVLGLRLTITEDV